MAPSIAIPMFSSPRSLVGRGVLWAIEELTVLDTLPD